MADFTPSLQKLLGHEGGYSNDPADSGGETFCGVTRRDWPKWEGWRYIDRWKAHGRREDLTLAREWVSELYHREYWHPLHCGSLRHQGLADALFSCGVNMGHRPAVRPLQRLVGAVSDGIMGTKTVAAINAYRYPDALLCAYCDEIAGFYKRLAKRRPKDQRFLNGWLARIGSLRNEAAS